MVRIDISWAVGLIVEVHAIEGTCSIILKVFCGSGAQPCLVDTDPNIDTGVISLVSGVCLPLQTFKNRARFPSFRKYAGLATLNASGQLAL